MSKKRVVVTGLGVISSIGIGKDAFWRAVVNGESGISKVKSFDTKDFRCHNAGELKDFESRDFIPLRMRQFLGHTSQLAIAAATLAIKDSGLPLENFKEKSGIFIGTTMGEKPLEESLDSWFKEGFSSVNKTKILQSSVNNISSNVGIYFKISGPNFLIPAACAAGNYALGYGFDLIRSEEINYALVGGVDSFSKIAFSGFQRLYAMAPEKCQPFDKNRKGMILGEGSAILILESLELAQERKANIYAEVLGYGLSCDAYHITAPKTEGIRKAMFKALKEANVKAENVDYINAHGTGTLSNDKTECAAIKTVFKESAKKIPVSSLKSMIGHAMGAASSIETSACCLALKHGIIPPTINFETADPECDIDCVPNKSRKANIKIILKNSFAFGGNNACLVLKKYEKE